MKWRRIRDNLQILIPRRLAFSWNKKAAQRRQRNLASEYSEKRNAAKKAGDFVLFDELRVELQQKTKESDLELQELESGVLIWRAHRNLVRLPPDCYVKQDADDWPGRYILRWELLPDLEHDIILAERETWKHRREWLAFWAAILFGLVTVSNVAWNVFYTQRKLAELSKDVISIQIQLAAQHK